VESVQPAPSDMEHSPSVTANFLLLYNNNNNCFTALSSGLPG